MNKKDKIEFIISTLESLYGTPSVPLKHNDEYTLLIAVLLSARCTDARVNQVTPSLFNLADNPHDMMLLTASLAERLALRAHTHLPKDSL